MPPYTVPDIHRKADAVLWTKSIGIFLCCLRCLSVDEYYYSNRFGTNFSGKFRPGKPKTQNFDKF